jgi:hypothetical protein
MAAMQSDKSAVSLPTPPTTALTREERRLVTAVWFLLFGSSLAWSISGPGWVVQIPSRIEQLGTAVALGAAAYLAYRANPRVKLGGSWHVVLYASVPAIALCAPLAGVGGPGTLFRASRFFVALAAMLLIAPLWQRDRWFLANTHARALRLLISAALLSYVLGKGLNPDGRLIAQVPALRAPQVGQFAAVLVGITAVQLIAGAPRLRRGPLWIALGTMAMLLSQTRTPLIALAIALGVALLMLCLTRLRARRLFACLVVAGPLLYVTLSPLARAYLRRNQSDAFLASLTGRRTAWEMVHEFPRTGFQELFGVGYGDKSIEGRPIDNGYLATYHELGKVGLAVTILVIAVLALRALACRRPANRALAVFLVTFVAIASYTETGIGDMSPYVMHLIVAGALVSPWVSARAGPPGPLEPARPR